MGEVNSHLKVQIDNKAVRAALDTGEKVAGAKYLDRKVNVSWPKKEIKDA